jgi:hypothetical protein
MNWCRRIGVVSGVHVCARGYGHLISNDGHSKKKIELMAKYPKNKENEEQDLWRIRLLSWRTT